LRGIQCPCMVLLGEHDAMFVKPSELLAFLHRIDAS
jgi:hypothetical protein